MKDAIIDMVNELLFLEYDTCVSILSSPYLEVEDRLLFLEKLN